MTPRDNRPLCTECGVRIVRSAGLFHCHICAADKRRTSIFAGLTKAELAVMRHQIGLKKEGTE